MRAEGRSAGRHGESGVNLIEILLGMSIMAAVIVAMVGAFANAERSAAVSADQARLEVTMRHLTDYVRSNAFPYVLCADTAVANGYNGAYNQALTYAGTLTGPLAVGQVNVTSLVTNPLPQPIVANTVVTVSIGTPRAETFKVSAVGAPQNAAIIPVVSQKSANAHLASDSISGTPGDGLVLGSNNLNPINRVTLATGATRNGIAEAPLYDCATSPPTTGYNRKLWIGTEMKSVAYPPVC